MAFRSPVFVAVLLCFLSSFTSTSAQSDSGNGCSCYRTNGSSAGYFTSHRFLDYRNVSPEPPDTPPVIPNATNATNALASSDFFLGDTWTSFWTAQNFNNSNDMVSTDATVLKVNSPSNVYIEKSKDVDPTYSTYLTLRTARLPGFQSAAEIDSAGQDYQFLSARFSARVVGSPGACAGIFTYRAGTTSQDVQEADIEILTRDPRTAVQYTNQPTVNQQGNTIPQATVNGTNPGGRDWTLWNVYRMDWMPGTTTWYVNGENAAKISFQTPRDPAGLIINMWGDGGPWTGNMSLYDQAYLQIQWIEIAYNTSGPVTRSRSRIRDDEGVLVKRKGTPGCKAVCGVDENITTLGTPVVLWNSTGLAAIGWKGRGMGSLAWIPLSLIGAAVFGWL